MRLRFTVLAVLASALVVVSLPASALAMRYHAPRRNHGLTIDATPNPIISGEAVLIYGQLNGPNPGNQWVYLYHRVNPAPGFSFIGRTKTNAQGFYEFARIEGVVTTNREWFATAPEYPRVHSRTVRERVAALVSLTASPPPSSTTTTVAGAYNTNHAIQFSGNVSPNHAGELVYLQEQGSATGNAWHTLKVGRLGPGSNYFINYRFRTPGAYTLRTLFRRDDRNIAAASTPLTVTVQQTENPSFTIQTSASLIQYGSSAQISGKLYLAGTTTPDPNVGVTLFGRTAFTGWQSIGLPTTTGMDGGYSFTVTPTNNTVYQVRTTFRPPKIRTTAVLFQGVQDVLSPNPVPPTAVVGQHITFTGSVSPDKAGHVIYLERFGADGYWHVVEVQVVRPNSTYQFGWTFGNVGTKEFRELIPGGPDNVGAATPEQTVTVSLPPVSTLPTNPSPGPIVNP